jgi:hypothetical protein
MPPLSYAYDRAGGDAHHSELKGLPAIAGAGPFTGHWRRFTAVNDGTPRQAVRAGQRPPAALRHSDSQAAVTSTVRLSLGALRWSGGAPLSRSSAAELP